MRIADQEKNMKIEIEKDRQIELSADNEYMSIRAVRDNVIHCVYSHEPVVDAGSMLVEAEDGSPLSLTESGDCIHVSAGKLGMDIDRTNGQIQWMNERTGKRLLKENKKEFIKAPVIKYTTGDEQPVIKRVKTVDGERNFIQNLREESDHDAYQGRLYFEFDEDEGIYGLGQAEEGVYDYRHHTHYMYQHNMRIPMPMFVSNKGYGILFDAACLMTFNDTESGSYMFFDAIDQLSYYVVAGEQMDEIIDGFRILTGRAVMLPKWAYGYIQSKEQYYTADELADIVKKYRELQVPLDCVVQDWNSWPKDQWGQKSLDPERYGNMREKADEIHALGAHTMVSVWPNMNTGTDNHTELFEAGYMLNDYATYDAFNEKAREIYWKQAKEGLFDRGFDSWWCDSTEPFSGPDWNGEIKREPWLRYQLVGTEHKKYLDAERANAYALVHAKGIYENQRKTREDMRVLNLTRSGYASGQKYGAMLWSGDITASWDVMRRQIAEGLNMAMSGYPYWTLDIGGFFTVGKKWQNRGCSCNTDPTGRWFWQGRYDEGVNDKGFCELYTRWIQMGCFLPMFRSHGTDTPREIWNFGSKGTIFYDAIEKYIKLRYRLMPYIYSLAGDVVLHNGTIMRSLLFDFADDKKAAQMATQYMFGKRLLVCPVLKPMYYEAGSRELQEEKVWNVYLPQGSVWYDFYTGEPYDGGQEIMAEAPLDTMPLYVRAGSVIPMTDGLQYAMEKNGAPLEIHIYPGADGSFTLYDDAGNDYTYEQGAYVQVRFDYDDAAAALTISDREGSYSGMETRVPYEIYIGNDKKCEGIYDGTKMTIALSADE